MIVKLLTEQHLGFLSLKGGCRDSSESTLFKMSNCWKSHATAHYYNLIKSPKPASIARGTSWSVILNVSYHKVYHYALCMGGDLNVFPDIRPLTE